MSNASIAYEGSGDSVRGQSDSGHDETSSHNNGENLSGTEAVLSSVAGAVLVGSVLRRPRFGLLPLAVAGAFLLYRGSPRHCPAYAAAGIDGNKRRTGPDAVGVVTISKPVEEVYRFWRDLNNLPTFMNIVDGVDVIDDTRSRWHSREIGGHSLSYEAEIVEDSPNGGIRWQSVSGSPIEMRGAVRFKEAPHGRGTTVIASLIVGRGEASRIAGRIIGPIAKYGIHQDLVRLKRLLETGEIATTGSQPVGSRNPEWRPDAIENGRTATARDETQGVRA